jgi:hypothetical protein
MWRVWGRREVCTGFLWGSLRERDHWGDPDVDGRIILRGISRKWEGAVGTGWSVPNDLPSAFDIPAEREQNPLPVSGFV